MFRYFQHPDWGTRSLLFVFTVGSAALSAYCGWSLASNSGTAIQIPFALLLGCIPLALGVSVSRASRYHAAHDYSGLSRMAALAMIMIPLNLLTDYGASSVIRDQTNVASAVQNTQAKDIRSALDRQRTELAALKSEKAWSRSDLLSPTAYDAVIFTAKQVTERNRNIWQRSKECTDTTLASSQEVCQRIGSALANKGLAERRLVLLAEVQQREAEIRQLEKAYNEGGSSEVSNPAMAQIKKIVSWATLSLVHSDEQVNWGENSVMLMITVALTAAISWFGWEMGQRFGALQDAPRPLPRELTASREAQVRAMADPAAYLQQHPLYSVDAPAAPQTSTANTTIVVKGRGSSSALDEALGRLNQHIAAAE